MPVVGLPRRSPWHTSLLAGPRLQVTGLQVIYIFLHIHNERREVNHASKLGGRQTQSRFLRKRKRYRLKVTGLSGHTPHKRKAADIGIPPAMPPSLEWTTELLFLGQRQSDQHRFLRKHSAGHHADTRLSRLRAVVVVVKKQ